jgi:hypothetical protein
MNERRIVVAFNPKGKDYCFTEVFLNHAYAKKFNDILNKSDHNWKTQLAKELIGKTFGTTNNEELKEKIIYCAEVQQKPISKICSLAIRKAIDTY